MKTLFSALLLAMAPIAVMAQEVVGITGPAIEPVTSSEMQSVPRRAYIEGGDQSTEVGIEVQYHQTEARAMLQLINDFRASDPWYWNSDNETKSYATGLKPLVIDENLEKIAMQRAAEIVINFGHVRPNGASWTDSKLWGSVSTNTKSENIAAGQSSYTSAFTSWREEEKDYAGQGHRRNMLNSNFNAIGIGCVKAGKVYAWTQAFANITSGLNDASDTTPCDEVVLVTTLLTNIDVVHFTNVYALGDNLTKEDDYRWSTTAELDKEIDTKVIAEVQTRSQPFSTYTNLLQVIPDYKTSTSQADAFVRLENGIIRSNGKPATLSTNLFAQLALTLKLTVPSVTPFTPAVPGKPDVADLVKFVNLYKDKKLPDYNGDGKSDDKDVEDLVSDLLKAIL